jgi:hypothetical protein
MSLVLMGTMAGAGATVAAPTFNPVSDWSLPPLHAFSTADSYWTPPADGGAVSSWRNAGSAAKGAYIGAKGLVCIGLITDYASTPDSSALDITGDITVVADVTAQDWTPAANISPFAKVGTSQNSYALTLLTTGFLRLYWTTDGSTSTTRDSTVKVDVLDGERLQIAATLDVDNGAAGHDVKFWTSTDGVTWTQLGSTVTTAGTTSIFSSTSLLYFGRSEASNFWIGTIHRAKIYNGIRDLNADTGGTLVLDANFEAATEDATSFTESSSNAATVTINSVPRAAHINANGLALQGNTTTARTDCAIIADNAVTRPTGDMELIVKATATDWTPAAGKVLVLSGDNGAYATINWYLYYNATGTLTFARPTGGTGRLFTSSVATGLADGATKWIKVVYDQDNGAGNAECKFYLSDDGSSWSQLGTTQTYASTLAGNSNTAGITIGHSYSGTFPHTGTIHRVIAKDGIDGTTFLDADFESATPNVSQFTESSSNALTVLINSSLDQKQTTGSRQPSFDAVNANYNGAPTVHFATDDALVSDITDIAQPYYMVVIGNVATAGVASDVFLGYGASTGNGLYEFSGGGYGSAISSTYALGGTSNTSPHLIRAGNNGAMSNIMIDESPAAFGGVTGSITVLSLGAGNSGVSTFGYHLTGDIHTALVFKSDPSLQPEWEDFKAYVESSIAIDVTPTPAALQAPTLLDSALYSPTNTCTSASISPTADSLLIITCVSGATAGTYAFSATTLSNISSWGMIQQSSGNERVGILWAKITGSPGTGTISITGFGSPGTTRAAMHVMEVVGAKDIRQTKIGTTTATTPSITLDYTPLASSLVVGAIGLYGVTIPPGTNFTELSESNSNRALETEYDLTDATTTVSWNLGASTLCCMAAIEVTD